MGSQGFESLRLFSAKKSPRIYLLALRFRTIWKLPGSVRFEERNDEMRKMKRRFLPNAAALIDAARKAFSDKVFASRVAYSDAISVDGPAAAAQAYADMEACLLMFQWIHDQHKAVSA
jgi:hypothetical protein